MHGTSFRSPDEYQLDLSGAGGRPPDLATAVHERACRTDLDAPGFCLVDLGPDSSSEALRRLMVSLVDGLRTPEFARSGRDLAVLSAGRFDQQVSTKFHRDGGPEESLLLLGYEPSEVASEVVIADYARAARDLEVTPAEFLARHNPMFAAGEELLRPYVTRLSPFSNRTYQLLAVNNAEAAYRPGGTVWQGVLHTATVRNPDEGLRRVINSMMLAPVATGIASPLTRADLDEFAVTSVVRRRGYDKPQARDDA